ncbi:MAG: PSD1 and planctomycete cytochrome C domain-containing protein [Acidobacteriota bacterium]
MARKASVIRRAVAGGAICAAGMAGFWFTGSSTLRAQDAAAVSFETHVQRIIFSNCQGCHTNGGHAGSLVMNTYETLNAGGSRGAEIVPGDAAASRLWQAMDYKDPSLRMPPRGRIPQEDIDKVRDWINSLKGGAPAPVNSAAAKPAEQPPQGRPMLAPAVAAKVVPPPAADAEMKTASTDAVAITPDQERFFESRIRPLLTENCYGCHTQAANGGLRLDSREAVLKGGKDGAVVVPGKPEESLLVRAIHYDAKLKMPPKGPLAADEVSALEQWVRQGLPWPKPTVANATVSDAARSFWSFQKPVRPVVPQSASKWAYNDLDRFVLAKQAENKLNVVGDADKRTLIRRATYDLTGLPPTPAEVEAFVADKSSDAYPKLVERLLASPAYGERWGRKWLDLVRYADTSGEDGDFPIPQAIKYRDWVIQAFNSDKPYDQFVRAQLAGDLMPSKSEDERWQNIVATGYLASAQRMEDRNGFLADAVDNLGYTYMGVSVACARCHNHKFDPIPTADYYSLYGIMKSTSFPNPGSSGVRYQTGFTYRDPKALQREDWKLFQSQLEPVANALSAVMKLPGTYDDLVPQLQVRRMNLFQRAPDLGESAYAVTEGQPQSVRVQIYGDDRNLGAEAPRGFPHVMGGGALPEDTKGSGRLELANWLTSSDHPLTARVMVNRIWQGHFGKGIVATPNDFGSRGAAPSNQMLLDYLATKFMDSGWSIKAMQREIMLSHTYQLSSSDDAANEKVDPDNVYLWRHSRHRLEAEEVRDSLLSMSGLLDTKPGAEHPFPAMSTWNFEQQNMYDADYSKFENDKRTVYMMVQRTIRPQFFILFDGPSTNLSTDQRGNSLTPLQALYFMNGDFPKRAAGALTKRVQAGATPEEAVKQAFLLVYGRPGSQEELDRTTSFLSNLRDQLATKGTPGTATQQEAFEHFVKALFASNEFMFVE